MTPESEPSREALAAFVGFLCYFEIGAFTLLSEDSAHAPNMSQRLHLARMAAARIRSLEQMQQLAEKHGAEAEELMASYAPIVRGFLDRATPRDWPERQIRSYVGFNLLEDFLIELTGKLPGQFGELTRQTTALTRHDEFVVAVLADDLASDANLSSRLALWGRRVVGEGLSLVPRIFASHPELAELLAGEGDAQQRESALMGRLQASHARRMSRLGLTS